MFAFAFATVAAVEEANEEAAAAVGRELFFRVPFVVGEDEAVIVFVVVVVIMIGVGFVLLPTRVGERGLLSEAMMMGAGAPSIYKNISMKNKK